MRYIFSVFFVLVLCVQELDGKPYQNLFKEHPDIPRSSIEGIDAIYVINLDVRPERWHRVEPILKYHGIDCSRFSAVFGWDFNDEILGSYCAKHLTVNQMGVMLSHLSIYQDALNRGLDCIWVMEDDVDIRRDPQLLTGIIKKLNAIDPEWDILYTDLDWLHQDGYLVESLAFPAEVAVAVPYDLNYYTYRKRVSKELTLLRARYGMTSMIMSKRGMEKVIKWFTEGENILWPVDIEIHYTPGLKQYGMNNPLATNAHFSFNHSDPGRGNIAYFYEIDDDHKAEMEQRKAHFQSIIDKWPEILNR